MSFTRPSIQERDRQVKLLFANGAKVSGLWEELPEESVEVFVTAAFPGMVGMGKVNGYARVSLQFFVVGHLTAVVERQAAPEMAGQWRE